MKVIKATNSLDDIEQLKEAVFEWRDSCNGKDFGIDLQTETFFSHLVDMINDEDKELFLLVKMDKVIGFLGAVIFQSPLGVQNIAIERFWFVSGKHRGRGAILLYRAFKKWAKEKGCSHHLMTASCLASDMHDRLCRFYEKIGFRKFETSYIKEL